MGPGEAMEAGMVQSRRGSKLPPTSGKALAAQASAIAAPTQPAGLLLVPPFSPFFPPGHHSFLLHPSLLRRQLLSARQY